MGRQKDSRKIGKEDKKAESQRAIEKEEIASTEFPEGGNTIYTKRTPWHPNGGRHQENFQPNFQLPIKKLTTESSSAF